MGNQVSQRDTLKQASVNDSLLGSSQQFQGGVNATASNNDYMMLKRLNFLRNTLNGHHTKQTTQFSREKANNIRDERILDLWKQDQEKPSVYEIVQSMKMRRESEKATETEFNSLLLQAKNKEELTKDHLNKTSIESMDGGKASPDNTNPKSVQWAQRPAIEYDHTKVKTAPKMNKTLHDKINKNKFSYKSDAEFSMQPKTGHSKVREDVVKNLKEAKEDFFYDFHTDISQKSRAMYQSIDNKEKTSRPNEK
jgi:hypothetical protein